jgi:hypothetical protein
VNKIIALLTTAVVAVGIVGCEPEAPKKAAPTPQPNLGAPAEPKATPAPKTDEKKPDQKEKK